MNIPIQRKQIFILALALALAVASYWIPTPQRTSSMKSTPGASDSIKQIKPLDSIAFSREPVTTWRFSVAEEVPSTLARADSVAKTGDALPSASPLPDKQFFKPSELANGGAARMDNVLIVPIKNPDHLLSPNRNH